MCYNVSVGSKSIIVQVIDACPGLSAYNWCKEEKITDPGQRCNDPNTQSLDIEMGAYPYLSPDGNPYVEVS